MDPLQTSSKPPDSSPANTDGAQHYETSNTSDTARICTSLSAADRQLFFHKPSTDAQRENAKMIADLLVDWTDSVPYKEMINQGRPDDNIFAGHSKGGTQFTSKELLMLERRARVAFEMYRDQFPTLLWHCCQRQCFASIAIDPQKLPLLKELRTIHRVTEEIHDDMRNCYNQPGSRRKGIGKSQIVGDIAKRLEREEREGIYSGTDRNRELQRLANFVMEVLPFLSGQEDANGCERNPSEKLCIKAICNLLGVSRSFLYHRKKVSRGKDPDDYELSSLVDTAGVRLRQHRRNRDRTGYPSIPDLSSYDCGCAEPCLSGLSTVYLRSEYDAFAALASALNPNRKENRYLLNVMFYPLGNCVTKKCDNALSALYTVSKATISSIRSILQKMCDDDNKDHRQFLEEGARHYRMDNRHPIYRYGPEIREKVENHLDFVLRADPAGADGSTVCRVYSEEINTKQKLRKSIAEALEDDGEVDDELSESTLQCMIDKYLEDRNCRISFDQNDHNACPTCKAQKYAILQYDHELKVLKRQYAEEQQREGSGSVSMLDVRAKLADLKEQIDAKRFQENRTLAEFEAHLTQDAKIRGTLKKWSDHFRSVECDYIRKWRRGEEERRVFWNLLPDHAIITHQDDMTKVDLPHFLVTASSDITRWRFDINAHVSSVNDDCVIFSHEQGTGAKTAASICEMIFLDHLVRCKGERIKVVVSDNASVGKNWLTTIVLPQYIVDQGLADIVFIVYLENNHGKWLADMLFGQLQTKRRKTTLLSVDDLLEEFEAINRRSGKVRSFAVNPLSSVDFSEIFASLGYQTKPPKDFGFIRRNIHFAAACKQVAKDELSKEMENLFGSSLPCEEGMVRTSSGPPTDKHQSGIPYEERFFDVPAARLPSRVIGDNHQVSRSQNRATEMPPSTTHLPPVVVPLEADFKESGNGYVPQRTAQHVGYNAFGFRKFKGYPELHDTSSRLVQRAWPPGLVRKRSVINADHRETADMSQFVSEATKCAPENWVVRRPVGHFKQYAAQGNWVARYPPRNLLNAQHGKAPRVVEPWSPTKTYDEPPFPSIEHTAANGAMKLLSERFTDINKSVTVLDVLREVYASMGDRDGLNDSFLQKGATVPSHLAQEHYRKELQLFVDRNKGHPSAVKSVRQFFKEDPEVIRRAEHLLSQQPGTTASTRGAKTKILAKLFDEASNSPGALDVYIAKMDRDMERFVREEREFRKKQEEFDIAQGLAPVPLRIPEH